MGVCVDHARVPAAAAAHTPSARISRHSSEKALRTILRVGLLNLTNPALRFLGSKMARLTGGDGSRDTKRQSRERARALVGSQSASVVAEDFTAHSRNYSVFWTRNKVVFDNRRKYSYVFDSQTNIFDMQLMLSKTHLLILGSHVVS